MTLFQILMHITLFQKQILFNFTLSQKHIQHHISSEAANLGQHHTILEAADLLIIILHQTNILFNIALFQKNILFNITLFQKRFLFNIALCQKKIVFSITLRQEQHIMLSLCNVHQQQLCKLHFMSAFNQCSKTQIMFP